MSKRLATARLVAVDARVVANQPICHEHAAIEVALSSFPESQPGQFLQLQCADVAEPGPRVASWPPDGFPSLRGREWQGTAGPFLRRPFSIADHWIDEAGHAHLLVISRAVGAGTRWLERLRAGDALNLTGPLGHGFDLPAAPVAIALVGGGVGIPPLLYLARRLHETGHRDVTAVFGATTRELLPVRLHAEPDPGGSAQPCAALTGGARFGTIITTDDGSVGLRGLVTDGLTAWHARREGAPGGGLVFACGPEPMLRAVAHLTRRWGLDCQLCIERNMGCGLGTCLSCVVRVRAAGQPSGWRWALACADGPVFRRDELLDVDTPARP